MTDYEYILERCRQLNNGLFVDEEFIDHGIYGYDNVISIKGCRKFWDEDGKRLRVIHCILNNVCDVVPQLIGWGDEVVFAVASDDYGLESDCKWTSEYLKSPLRRKIDEITQKAYHKNLVLGCMLVEKFIHIVDPKVNAKVQCHDKDYLLGRFVIVCPDELFTTIDTITTIKDLAPKGKKMDAFMDLLDNLLAPPWKVPF